MQSVCDNGQDHFSSKAREYGSLSPAERRLLQRSRITRLLDSLMDLIIRLLPANRSHSVKEKTPKNKAGSRRKQRSSSQGRS
jgi:hypothetical protein